MTENRSMKDHYRNPEEVGISFKIAEAGDLNSIKEFLSRPEIDSAFKPQLSDPVRGITVDERVDKKFKQGIWVIAIHERKTVGCMAVVPSKLSLDVPEPDPNIGLEISEGISLRKWGVERIMELSSVVTDSKIKEALNVKYIGEDSLGKAVEWVKKNGKKIAKQNASL